jgi:hypothetical protein
MPETIRSKLCGRRTRLLSALGVLALTLGGCGADKAPPAPGGAETDASGDTGGGDDGVGDDTAPGVDSEPGGDSEGEVETVSPTSEPWVRQEEESPGPITFTELLYHPLEDAELEWIELYNPMALDMDLSGWSLDDGVSYTFPEGTVLAAGGYLVVAASPERLAEAGFAGALGPYEGKLDNGGERVALVSNAGRLIDSVEYGEDDPWPVHADGSGVSLAKIAPSAASQRAESWTASAEVGGTPGADNQLDPLALPTVEVLVPEDAEWRYDVSGGYPAADWAAPDYDDSGWESGQAIFYAGGGDEDVGGVAWVTADNYFALYLGQEDGSDLRWVGEDTDGSWTSVEEIDLEVGPLDHLYLAAWELTGDSTSPQMTIGEFELADEVLGTDIDGWEWVLGPSDANPGALPGGAPSEEALLTLIEEANADSAWAAPAVEASRGSDPWAGSVSGDFTDVAYFIWGDTFEYNSLTNSEDTYALFRTRSPAVPPPGSLELEEIVTTTTFRTDFTFEGDPGAAILRLDCSLDDGAIVYLNGVEVLRENLPAGAVTADTLASSEVGAAAEISAEISVEISALALVSGRNVLAAELHQAAAKDLDMSFGCALTAEILSSSASPTILLSEVSAAGDAPWVELVNVSGRTLDVGGLLLASSAGEEVALEGAALEPGGLLLLEDPGLSLEGDDRLFLYSSDGAALLDAVRLSLWPRAREEGGGPWRVPVEATPGEANAIVLSEDVVINEIQYHRAPLSEEGEAYAERDEEWIELFNRGGDEVDLSGWQLVDAVAFEFPEGTALEPGGFLVVASDAEALRAAYPEAEVVGDFEGGLSNGGDRILLLDAVGNPADEVRYFDGGRWPAAADGGGASLELRDPWADNAAAESWAASDELGRSEWVEVSYRGVAGSSSVGPDGVWEELVLGLLDDGEVLIDDVSVIRDPGGAATELVQDGGFDDPGPWRLLGTHRHSAVVPDPDDPSNPVLRLVATGQIGHMHNHIETTLEQSISAVEYEIAFRARWVSGSNQLNSRLYFNRLARTTLVPQPALSGTPGAENSTLEDNTGPTFSDLAQDVAVPASDEPVQVSITVSDPDGVAAVTLWSSVDGGGFQAVAMAEDEPGVWWAELEGQ